MEVAVEIGFWTMKNGIWDDDAIADWQDRD